MTVNPQLTAVIIDDEPQIRKLLRRSLDDENYVVFEAENGRLGIMEIVHRKPDVVLLDLGLPDMDGMDVLRELREWSTTPVIILSVREGIDDKVRALDAGADDYLTKPFHPAELFARLRAVVRHAQGGTTQSSVTSGPLTTDFASRQVFLNTAEVHLTATEYALLKLLATNIGKVVTQKQLLTSVWGPSGEENSHYLRVYMRTLRRKVEDATKLIVNEPGIGYRLLKQ